MNPNRQPAQWEPLRGFTLGGGAGESIIVRVGNRVISFPCSRFHVDRALPLKHIDLLVLLPQLLHV